MHWYLRPEPLVVFDDDKEGAAILAALMACGTTTDIFPGVPADVATGDDDELLELERGALLYRVPDEPKGPT